MRILFLIGALFAFASTANAVRCYVCNSHNDTECLDIKPGTKQKFLTDCDTLGTHKYTMCRKIYMRFDDDFTERHPAENRIHRACGYIEGDEEEGPCYYKSGHNTRSWVCSCDKDDCNTATSRISSLTIIISSLIFVATGFCMRKF